MPRLAERVERVPAEVPEQAVPVWGPEQPARRRVLDRAAAQLAWAAALAQIAAAMQAPDPAQAPVPAGPRILVPAGATIPAVADLLAL